ncbi:hypothetical protein HBH56_062730 [Parastagonospora nodorum]|uniref:Secreted protein n=1 Tax=Phaeosphaeria nodorum (strain SN15 / ATCC MYA-4574 / FGSC 10173) TaxID=321614 RepID=A0A7U2HXV4_PHANO|nr:hypothetical protein HBH56_062730 [Parastagonospora nodorum]QRC92082.1 hypothetical protein JI435_401920 [Parastagonospora nodorum SN15]KAH3930893.1 hypothetical protein HBH54_106670 [Parastagonospora nodorum]KAH3954098.1 hypothetical protein HBH53_021610 [Parastagonospora nodorum]KAH4017793.1 hypothetical protein HBI09_194380 [Parastagonospora nodorum]
MKQACMSVTIALRVLSCAIRSTCSRVDVSALRMPQNGKHPTQCSTQTSLGFRVTIRDHVSPGMNRKSNNLTTARAAGTRRHPSNGSMRRQAISIYARHELPSIPGFFPYCEVLADHVVGSRVTCPHTK